MRKVKYRQFLADLQEKLGYCPSHTQLSEILNKEVTANALSNRYSMDGYIRPDEMARIIDFYENQNGNKQKANSSDVIKIPYWERLPEELKHPEYTYVLAQRASIEQGWKLKPENLRIISMNGDKLENYWYKIRNNDVLIIDTSETKINANGAGVYFATSRNNTMYWVREMQALYNGNGIEFNAYSPSGNVSKILTTEQLEEADFKIIGKVIKNVSFRL